MPDSPVESVREIWRSVDRPIWIVTAAEGQSRAGLVATLVMQSSLQMHQPGVLIGLGPNHRTCELALRSKEFALHLLRQDQVEVAWNFGMDSSRDRDKFAHLAVEEASSPILSDCRAWMECRVLTKYDTGDRIFFWGEVVRAKQLYTEPPLCESHLLQSASAEQLAKLQGGMESDIRDLEPGRQKWRNSVIEQV